MPILLPIGLELAIIILALLGLIIDRVVEKTGWLSWLHNDSAPIISFVIGAAIGGIFVFSGVALGPWIAGGIAAMGSDGLTKIIERSKSLASPMISKIGPKKPE